MGQRANFQKKYLLRYLMFVAVCFPLALWFFYDGFIGYPKQLPAAVAFEPLRKLDSEERRAQWESLAEANNWPLAEPKKTPKEIESDIVGQYVFGTIGLVVAAIALCYYFACRGTWVERTATGLTTSWGQNVDFSKVSKLNKTRWERKGIAKATYSDHGKIRTFTFDDFKFDRPALDQMLYELEQVLKSEQIVGGPPEKPPKPMLSSDSGMASTDTDDHLAKSSADSMATSESTPATDAKSAS